jgi:hypothetical protein
MNDAVDRYIRFFEALAPISLHRLNDVFDSNARFKDPFNDVCGIDGIRRVFEDMYEQCEAPRFTITDVACEGDTCFIGWTFYFRRRKSEFAIEGVSRVRFGVSGRAVEHIDYWDPASQLYESIPLLGAVLKALRRRLSTVRSETTSHSTKQAACL